VYLESDEQATLDEWRAAVKEALGSPDYRPGMSVLHDTRRAKRVAFPEEARVRVWFLMAQTRRHNVARWATVVEGLANYGMGRMAEALVDHERSVSFRIFTDMFEAEVWVRERPPAA
jgi:hypothetical protein